MVSLKSNNTDTTYKRNETNYSKPDRRRKRKKKTYNNLCFVLGMSSGQYIIKSSNYEFSCILENPNVYFSLFLSLASTHTHNFRFDSTFFFSLITFHMSSQSVCVSVFFFLSSLHHCLSFILTYLNQFYN